MNERVKRREFITLLGGSAIASSVIWPLAARAQQPQRMRRIGVFMPLTADDPEAQARNAAFLQGLGELGWTVGRNVRIDYRWGAGDAERYRAYAAELVALAPDVIFALGSSTVSALQKVSRTVPIVFVNVTDPVGGSLIASLARPGGNATGFTSSEFGFSGKWLELLKEIAPRVTRVAVLRDSAIAAQMGLLGGIQSVAPSLGVELRPVDLSDAGEIERAVATFAGAALASEASGQRGDSKVRAHSASEDARKRADDTRPEPGSSAREPNGGLIVTSGARAILHRELIVTLAARHRLPAVYAYRTHVASGGLISYGIDNVDQFRRAAGYVDRILKGEKPADLPVQAPTKFELAINLKTAKALGLDVPAAVLARADEVIE